MNLLKRMTFCAICCTTIFAVGCSGDDSGSSDERSLNKLEAAELGGPAEPDGPSAAAVVDGEAALDAEVLDPGGADQAVVPDLQI